MPSLRAMAETLSPCRFKSWIKTISPSVITCLPLPFGAKVGVSAAADLRGHAPQLARGAQTGEFSNGTFGEITLGTHT